MTAPESAAERIAACSQCGQHLMVPQESELTPPKPLPPLAKGKTTPEIVFEESPKLSKNRRRVLRQRNLRRVGLALTILLLLTPLYFIPSSNLQELDAAANAKEGANEGENMPPADTAPAVARNERVANLNPPPRAMADPPAEAEPGVLNRAAIEALKAKAWQFAIDEVSRIPGFGKVVGEPNVEVMRVSDDGTVEFLCKGESENVPQPGLQLIRQFTLQAIYSTETETWFVKGIGTSLIAKRQAQFQQNPLLEDLNEPANTPQRVVGSWKGDGSTTTEKFQIAKGPWSIRYQAAGIARRSRRPVGGGFELTVRDEKGNPVAMMEVPSRLGRSGRFTIEQPGKYSIEVKSNSPWVVYVNESK